MILAPAQGGSGPTLRWHREIKEILRLAIPLATAQLAQMLMGITDAVMMGRIGTVALAAGGLGSAIALLLIVMSQGLLQSLQPMIAQARGAGHRSGFGAALAAGFAVAALVMLPIILLLLNISAFLLWIGEPTDIAVMTQFYGSALAWGVPFALFQSVLRNYLSALGSTRIIMVASVGAFVANIGFNWVLIFGHLGFPALGLAGSGFATSLSWFGIMLTFGLYAWQKGLLPPDLRHVPFVEFKHSLRAIVSLGWPISGILAIEIGLFSGASLLMGKFGAEVLAAHQICFNLCSLTFMVPLALGMAATIRVGLHIGAGNPVEARLAGYTAIVCGAVFMAVSAIVMLWSADWIVRLYLGATDPTVPAINAIFVSLLTVAAAFQVFDGIQTVAAGALRGLKDTRPALIYGIVSYWLIGMPVGVVLSFRAGFGPVGIWLGFLVGLIVVSVLLAARFKQKTGSIIRAVQQI